jgi:uncharacterized iron-regulated membrane protein
MLLVIVSGLLLQVKKQSNWVQPPTQRGVSKDVQPEIEWPALLELAKTVPEAEIEDWADIDRLDVRPSKGVVKLQSKNRWELQIDLQDGTLLSSTYRRSDFIESLHDGSFFSDAAKLWIFLPNGLVLLGLWVSGAWLWYLPVSRRKSKRRK